MYRRSSLSSRQDMCEVAGMIFQINLSFRVIGFVHRAFYMANEQTETPRLLDETVSFDIVKE